jgi:hypothetical protein
MSQLFKKGASAFVVAIALTISHAAPAKAFFFLLDPDVNERIEFFLMCKELMFSDPAAHKKTCNPNAVFQTYDPIEDVAGNQDDTPPPPPAQSPTPPSNPPYSDCLGECDSPD